MDSTYSDSVTWQFPLKTVSEANCSEHWSKKAKRHKQQQQIITMVWHAEEKTITLPCKVTFTRLAQRALDDDNLRSAMKYIRDEISELLAPELRGFYISKKGKTVPIKGRADSLPTISWHYAQESAKIMGIRICFEF